MLTNGPEEHYSERYDFGHLGHPYIRLMIATMPRTGGTQLCLDLWRTGQAGIPLEYLNIQLRRHDMIPRLGQKDPVAYWHGLGRCRTSPNGVFSFKVFPSDLQQVRKAAPELLELISPDKIVYLTRRNKLFQAISWVRAQQTNKWFADAKARREPEYDTDQIMNYLNAISMQEAAWERYFSRQRSELLRISYEDYEIDRQHTVDSILDLIGVEKDTAEMLDIEDMKIQRDALTIEWAERFKSEVALEDGWSE